MLHLVVPPKHNTLAQLSKPLLSTYVLFLLPERHRCLSVQPSPAVVCHPQVLPACRGLAQLQHQEGCGRPEEEFAQEALTAEAGKSLWRCRWGMREADGQYFCSQGN